MGPSSYVVHDEGPALDNWVREGQFEHRSSNVVLDTFETPLTSQHVSVATSLGRFGCQMIAMNADRGGRRISGHAGETTNTRQRWLLLAEVGG